jgi:hypothetical protein
MDRPADLWGRGRSIAALAAVFAVLVMHGVSCMAGGAHTAGMPVIATAPATHLKSQSQAHACADCHHHDGGPVGEAQGGAVGPPPRLAGAWVGGITHHGEHGGVPCIAILTGLALLALLAAAAATAGPPVLPADGVWLRLRPRPPTALLRPSLSQLCVLRI